MDQIAEAFDEIPLVSAVSLDFLDVSCQFFLASRYRGPGYNSEDQVSIFWRMSFSVAWRPFRNPHEEINFIEAILPLGLFETGFSVCLQKDKPQEIRSVAID